MELHELPIRLAIRHEGNFVNAYLANADTMENSIMLGSFLFGLVQHEDLFEKWKDLMTEAMSLMVEKTVGEKPVFIERPAPPHDKSGNS